MTEPNDSAAELRVRDDSFLVEWSVRTAEKLRERGLEPVELPLAGLAAAARIRWWRKRVHWAIEDRVAEGTLPPAATELAIQAAFEIEFAQDGWQSCDLTSSQPLGATDLEYLSAPSPTDPSTQIVDLLVDNKRVGRIRAAGNTLRAEFPLPPNEGELLLLPVRPDAPPLWAQPSLGQRTVFTWPSIPPAAYLCAALASAPLRVVEPEVVPQFTGPLPARLEEHVGSPTEEEKTVAQ